MVAVVIMAIVILVFLEYMCDDNESGGFYYITPLQVFRREMLEAIFAAKKILASF